MTQNDTGVPGDDQGCAPDDIVYVIQSNYHYNDADNRRAIETGIVEDEGWFATEEAARSRAETLGQASMTFYEGEVERLRRVHEREVEAVRAQNEEIKILRNNGVDKDFVAEPGDFEAPTYEAFNRGRSYTTYDVEGLRRSEIDPR